MKKLVLVLGLVCAVISSAQAREFYSVPLKVKVYYKNMNESRKVMGSIKGTLQAGSDGTFAKLVINGEEVPFKLSEFGVHQHSACLLCTELGPYRPHLKFTISRETLKKVALEADHAWYRGSKTKKYVASLIERYLGSTSVAGTMSGVDFEVSAYYTDYTYISDADDTKTTIQLTDNQSPESVEVVFDVGNSVRVH